MILEERKAARAYTAPKRTQSEREAAPEWARAEPEAVADRARVDSGAAAAEQLRFLTEGFELRLHLARGNRSQSGDAGGEPWIRG